MTPLTLDLAGKKWPDLASKIPSVNSYAIAFKSIFLNKVRTCNRGSRKELFFKQKNKSFTTNGAKAKLIGFWNSEDLMSTSIILHKILSLIH